MEQFANNATTTLSGGIDNVQTSLTVVDETPFSPDENYRIKIDSELLLVTGGAGTPNWTVTRGIEGTTAASHANGATVSQVLTAGALQQFRADNVQSDTVANLPANTQEGVTYWPTNGVLFYRDTGSVWQTFGPVYRFVPPVNGDFTWLNQGASTVSEVNGGIHLSVPGNNGGTSARYMAMPATPYTLTVALTPCMNRFNYCGCGIFIRDSSTGTLTTIQYGQTPNELGIFNLTNPTTYSSTVVQANTPISGPLVWLRIFDDGTDIAVSNSFDGFNFAHFHTFDRDGFVTNPDNVGFHVGNETNQGNVGATLLSWEIT